MNTDISEKFQRNLSFYIGFAGSVFLLSFGIKSLLGGHPYLGLILLSSTAVVAISLSLMAHLNQPHIAQNAISIVVVFLFSYLTYSGGIEGTGVLWAYPLVLIILLLQGFKRGIVVLGLLILIALYIFYGNLDQAYQYNSAFKIRFISSFVALSLMALIYEHQRWKAHEASTLIHEKLRKSSLQDPLTNLLNRRASNDVMEKEHSGYLRNKKAFSIIMIDLDLFKKINDTYGHIIGDQVLVAVAKELSENTRKGDHVVRWGGEEFIIILHDTNKEKAIETAESLRSRIFSLNLAHIGIEEGFTASFGVQSIQDSKDVDDLIIQADKKLYQAKQQGRNRVIF